MQTPIGRRADGAFPLLIEGLAKSYGSHSALSGITLEVEPGEVFAYLGPNGAGKTTTLRLLMGFLRPTRGRATVFGLDCWSDAPMVHRRVGYVGGDVALYERMTGRQLLGYLARLRGDVDEGHLRDLVTRLGANVDRPIRTLSTSNRAKLAIVQAFMAGPELLLLDEPTLGLDPLVQREVHAMLREHVERGGAVVLSSHVLSEVQEVADRVGLLRGGTLLAVERLEDLRAHALHHVSVTFDHPVSMDLFRMDGVRDVAVDGRTMRCAVMRPAIDPLLHRVTRQRVTDFSCTESSLEEMFLAHYGEGVSRVA
jgi:ABC-2 type transport system ATP-binding protein